jgi:hypothetical protein
MIKYDLLKITHKENFNTVKILKMHNSRNAQIPIMQQQKLIFLVLSLS